MAIRMMIAAAVIGGLLIVGVTGGMAVAQEPCPGVDADEVDRVAAPFVDSARALTDHIDALRTAVEGQTEFEAGWTRSGAVGEIVDLALQEAARLEQAANSLGGDATEVADVASVLEGSIAELDEARNRRDALTFFDRGGTTSGPCGIGSTVAQVAEFVASGDAFLPDTGRDPALLVLVAAAALVGGTLLITTTRRRPTHR